jgi:hypothetical protein
MSVLTLTARQARVVAFVVTLTLGALSLSVLAASALASRPFAPHAPTLAEADHAPTHLVYLYPHAVEPMADSFGHTCYGRKAAHVRAGGYYTDVGAYAWNGAALGAQRISADGLRYVWRARGGAVTWDGATWRNHSRVPVLVAGWCERGTRGVPLED